MAVRTSVELVFCRALGDRHALGLQHTPATVSDSCVARFKSGMTSASTARRSRFLNVAPPHPRRLLKPDARPPHCDILSPPMLCAIVGSMDKLVRISPLKVPLTRAGLRSSIWAVRCSPPLPTR